MPFLASRLHCIFTERMAMEKLNYVLYSLMYHRRVLAILPQRGLPLSLSLLKTAVRIVIK